MTRIFNYLKVNFLNEVYQFANKGSVRLFLLLFLFLILLRKIIVGSYNKIVIEGFLMYIPSSYKTDAVIIVFSLSVIIFFFVYYYLKNRRQNLLYFLYIFVITAIYCHFRNKTIFTFTSFYSSWLNNLYYFDVIYLFFTLSLASLIQSVVIKFTVPKYSEDELFIDAPITKKNQDAYGRTKFAEQIARKIMYHYDNKSSLAIGINGPWGSGKTSFLYLIKNEIEQNKKGRIIIDFHPWKSTSTQQIITDFFDEFIDEIQKFSPNLSGKLKLYSKSLADVDENLLTKSIDTVVEFVHDSSTKEDLYNEINQSLETMNKQIIVFIDDVDRLDKNEVIEVIRLIRNTASFHNVIFIVTYDREYVVNSIKNLNDINPQQYLEKIFQFEFILPPYERTVLKDFFKDKVFKELSPNHQKQLDAFLYPTTAPAIVSREDFFHTFIKTNRDVVRFSNIFLFDYKNIKSEIDLVQFGLLSLLKVKHPDIYDLLFDMQEKFFFFDTSLSDRMPMSLRRIHDEDLKDNSKNNDEPNPYVLEQYLKDCHPLKLIKCDIHAIIALLETLFVPNPLQTPSTLSPLSITNHRNFYKYFTHRVFEGEISIQEFSDAMELSLEELKIKIDQWLKEDKLDILASRLQSVKLYELGSKENFEKHIKILFHFGEQTARPGSGYFVDTNHLFNLLQHDKVNDKGVIEKWYENSEEKYFDFVRNLFKLAPPPYSFPSWFISVINYQYLDHFILSTQELINYNVEYFRNYFSLVRDIDDKVISLFYNNKISNKVNQTGNSFQLKTGPNKMVNEIFLNGIIEYNLIDKFIPMLVADYSLRGRSFTISNDFIKDLFDNSTNFESFINELFATSKNPIVKEFIDFYTALKQNGFQSMDYNFKLIKIKRNR